MDYNRVLQTRITTAEEAVRNIHSGQRIFLTGNCSVPQTVLKALVEYAPQLENVQICQALSDLARPPLSIRSDELQDAA